ncbi:hypothetical protein Tco_0478125 [Tanacetum coccineum]
MENRENERMILNSVQNGPLIWPTITEENDTTQTKTYAKLFATEKIQADCDCKAINIGETLYQYYWRFAQLINNMNVINMSMRAVQVNTKFLNSLPPEWSLAILVFSQGDDPIACLNKAMDFLTVVASSRFPSTNNQLIASSNPRNQATIQLQCNKFRGGKGKVILVLVIRSKRQRNATWFKDKAMLAKAQEARQILDEEQLAFLADPGIPDGKAIQTAISNNVAFQTEDLDAYDSDCDDVSNAKAVLMANISNYGSDVISEVPHSETYHNDMENQSEHAMQDFKQTHVVDFTDNEITSDSNIIFHEKMIDSQMDDMIKEKLALNVISSQHVAMPMIDDDETLILEEVSRSKMLEKQNDPIFKEKKVYTTPINYVDPSTDSSDASPVIVEVPSELLKVSLVNASLKKLKFYLSKFDSVVKKRTTSDALTEDVLLSVMDTISLNGESVNVDM